MCTTPCKLPDRVVACGHCIECLIKRSQEWAFRLDQESKTALSGCFVTLTYNDEHAVWVDTESGKTVTTLHKPDFQKFMKRVRKYDSKYQNHKHIKIRYFACGEYGTKMKRAHYHAIIFNLDRRSMDHIPQLWNLGFATVDECNGKTMRYVTNYMLLKNLECEDEQQNPWTLMSKKPILGANYVIQNYPHHHDTQDYKLKCPKGDRNLPRAFSRKIFTQKEIDLQKPLKEEEFIKFTEEKNLHAEKMDPLDPIGWQKLQTKFKEQSIKRRQQSKL